MHVLITTQKDRCKLMHEIVVAPIGSTVRITSVPVAESANECTGTMNTNNLVNLFHKDNLYLLVQTLKYRKIEIAEALEWIDDSSKAASFQLESKLIGATFTSLRDAYGHSYIESILMANTAANKDQRKICLIA